MKNYQYTAAVICDLSENNIEGEIVACNTLNSRNLLILTAKNKLECREEKNYGFSSKIKTPTGQNYYLYVIRDNDTSKILEVENEKFNIHNVQALPDNTFLLVCGRSEYRSDSDYDLNGRIYSSNGSFLKGILLGDGIQDVQVSRNGAIWTSYFDEGVFGNYGWDKPVGSCGLIAWKSSGEAIYEYSPTNGLDAICDCYAINVETDNVTWAYYYTDFPLVKIENGKITNYWDAPIKGSNAFAVFQDYAVFRGGYGESNALYVIRLLDNHVASVLQKIELSNIDDISWMSSRGDAIFFICENKIYRITVNELLDSIKERRSHLKLIN